MSDNVVIYHNPRCSKSRATLQLLEERGETVEIIKYLDTPPSKDTLIAVLSLLQLSPRQLMRRGEAEFRDQNLDNPELSDEALIDAMLNTPKLIERPIVVKGARAAIGRPPETVLDIL